MTTSTLPAALARLVALAVVGGLLVPALASPPAHADARAIDSDVRAAHQAWESSVAPVKAAGQELATAEAELAAARERAAAAEAARDEAATRVEASAVAVEQAEAAVVKSLARARVSRVEQQSALRALESAQAGARSRAGDLKVAGIASHDGSLGEESRIRNEHGRAQLEVAVAWHEEASAEYEQHRTELEQATVHRDAASAGRQAAEEEYEAALEALSAAVDEADASAETVVAQRDALAAQREAHDEALTEFRGLGWRAGVLGRGGLVWPTDGSPGSKFGTRKHPISGRVRLHAGVDVPAPVGQNVVATADGTVTAAGANGGYGFVVDIDHGDGRVSRYAHLSYIHVRTGDTVVQGQRIGRIGSTGASTGPHLHFEYRVHGEPKNPMEYFSGVIGD